MPTQNGKPTPKSLKIFFHAIDGIGHLNACAGMGQALLSRGHRIYFLINESFANQFTKYGFTEIVLKTQHKTNNQNIDSKNVVKEIAKLMVSSGLMCAKSQLEKLKQQKPEDRTKFMDSMFPTFVQFNPQIEQAIEREKPDLFILDSILVPPSVQKAGLPWITHISAHPFSVLNSDKLPPFGAGYPTKSDPSTWEEFAQLSNASFNEGFGKYQSILDAEFNYTPIKRIQVEVGSAYPISPYLNIYGYPQELDYHDLVEIPDNFVRVDAFMREEVEEQKQFKIPEELNVQPGDKLIYVSLGSMGSIDVDLMKRILAVLGKTDHKYIVSKGQRSDEFELPRNCWGENFLPQTRILPLVDLVITHGGNNTVCESLLFGKPMIVMPLFGDQFDSAQRVHEKKYGIRVEPYSFTEPELLNAISQLLHDTELHQRLQDAKERMAKSNSKKIACERIEQIVTK